MCPNRINARPCHRHRTRASQQRGGVLILFALTLVLLLGIGGLAIDVGLAYISHAKLASAVDAASLAAVKAMSEDATISLAMPQRIDTGRNAARNFFDANYPDNFLGTTKSAYRTDISIDPLNGKVIVDVAASATVPVYLMRVFDLQPISVGAGATASTNCGCHLVLQDN